MSLKEAHALPGDLKNYDIFITTEYYSVAEFIPAEGNRIASFEHYHDNYEFIIPFTTIPILIYQNTNYLGEVGYCYPVNPYTNHGIEFDLTSRVLSIAIDKNYLNKIKEEHGFKDKYFYTRFLLTKDIIYNLAQFKITYNNIYIENTINLIVEEGLKNNTDNRKPKKIYFKGIKYSILYMFEHYDNPELTIKEVAEVSEYSYTYFTKAFSLYMHLTPVMYLNKLRLSKAKELMKDRNLTLGDICKMSGYNNISTFTESFKKIVGMLPKEYRKKYIE